MGQALVLAGGQQKSVAVEAFRPRRPACTSCAGFTHAAVALDDGGAHVLTIPTQQGLPGFGLLDMLDLPAERISVDKEMSWVRSRGSLSATGDPCRLEVVGPLVRGWRRLSLDGVTRHR
jgi:hypothetical protein